jgi:hypothetical protein
MNKKDIIIRLFIIALTLYFAFFIWTVWFESPGNHDIIWIIEEWYMKSIGKVISLILLACAIVEGVFRGISLVVDHIKNKIIQKNFF